MSPLRHKARAVRAPGQIEPPNCHGFQITCNQGTSTSPAPVPSPPLRSPTTTRPGIADLAAAGRHYRSSPPRRTPTSGHHLHRPAALIDPRTRASSPASSPSAGTTRSKPARGRETVGGQMREERKMELTHGPHC